MLKRIPYFAGMVAGYFLFLAFFLYAFAWVGGSPVPGQFDQPLVASLPAAIAINCLIFAVFVVLHSVLAWALLDHFQKGTLTFSASQKR